MKHPPPSWYSVSRCFNSKPSNAGPKFTMLKNSAPEILEKSMEKSAGKLAVLELHGHCSSHLNVSSGAISTSGSELRLASVVLVLAILHIILGLVLIGLGAASFVQNFFSIHPNLRDLSFCVTLVGGTLAVVNGIVGAAVTRNPGLRNQVRAHLLISICCSILSVFVLVLDALILMDRVELSSEFVVLLVAVISATVSCCSAYVIWRHMEAVAAQRLSEHSKEISDAKCAFYDQP